MQCASSLTTIPKRPRQRRSVMALRRPTNEDIETEQAVRAKWGVAAGGGVLENDLQSMRGASVESGISDDCLSWLWRRVRTQLVAHGTRWECTNTAGDVGRSSWMEREVELGDAVSAGPGRPDVCLHRDLHPTVLPRTVHVSEAYRRLFRLAMERAYPVLLKAVEAVRRHLFRGKRWGAFHTP